MLREAIEMAEKKRPLNSSDKEAYNSSDEFRAHLQSCLGEDHPLYKVYKPQDDPHEDERSMHRFMGDHE
jgi:hypothetical protein